MGGNCNLYIVELACRVLISTINAAASAFAYFFPSFTCDSFSLQTSFFLWKFYCVTVSLFSNTVAWEEATLYF